LVRGPRAEIDLAALRHNLRYIRSLSHGLPVIAVVKADAYGHGALEVSRALITEGVSKLGVAFVSEALALRESGIDAEIIVFFDAGSIDKADPALFFEHRLTPVVNSLEEARAFSREAVKRKKEISIHVKVDTGMGRMGLNGGDPGKDILKIASLPNLKVEWLMSHFSDVGPEDLGYARLQLQKLKNLKSSLARKGVKASCHMSSSASTLLLPESYLDGLRVGLLLYGALPFESLSNEWDFKPVMKVKTNIRKIKKFKKGEAISYERSFITGRDSLIAVLPVGYADGYHRAMSNKAQVVIKGVRAPQVGKICMDLTMADITDIKGVKEGDEAVLLGEGISHRELAAWAGTNPYEIMTSFGRGARRSYV
jgi:alanine racemase